MAITDEPLYIGLRDLGLGWVTKESANNSSKVQNMIKLC